MLETLPITITTENLESLVRSVNRYREETWNMMGKQLNIKKVVYNDPATVVYWDDGSKTVVKCHEEDVYDERTGFLLCCAKKLFGNTGRFNEVVKEHTPEKTRPMGLLEAMNNLFATVGL